MYREITHCRVCGNSALESILNLGDQYLTGVFPKTPDGGVGRTPVELVKCYGPSTGDHCGLVQSRYSYDLEQLYGGDYGYRSGLNRSMVEHLAGIVRELTQAAAIHADDIVLDIGSNDGTLLSFYPADGPLLVGFDPTADKFAKYYRPHVHRVADFFSAEKFRSLFGDRKAKIVTSIAMFYDLDQPLDFMRQVAQVLADDGLWRFEQSYLPAMLASNSYDTACHEHLEYYALRQIKYMIDRAGMKIVGLKFNDVNGGSFSVTAAKANATYAAEVSLIEEVLRDECQKGLDSLPPYRAFAAEIVSHREKLLALLRQFKAEGQLVLGYGASTKGNVLLQFCGITPDLIPCIAEVNEEKFGCFTPGTNIPIVSESKALSMKPACFLVLPWHFRRNILARETAYLQGGGKFIFPLPNIEVVGR